MAPGISWAYAICQLGIYEQMYMKFESNTNNFFQEYALENVICKMVAILSSVFG